MSAANRAGAGVDSPAPGQILAAARQAQGLSLETLHEKTLIPVWKLKAMEADQYQQLGGRPFAVGYLRQVAKLLELDPDPLVAQFNRVCKPEIPIEALPEQAHAASPKGPSPRSQSPVAALWSPWTLLILVALWSASVWLFHSDGTEERDPLISESLRAPAEEDLQQDPIVPDAEAMQSNVVDAEALGQPEVQPSAPPVESEPVQSEQSGLAEPVAPPAALQAVPEPGARDQIAMRFDEPCWVEVRDVHGALLVAQLYDKEDNLQLFGEGPFSVLLGNASAAEVTMNGNPVPVVPRGTQRTLRLQVSARPAN